MFNKKKDHGLAWSKSMSRPLLVGFEGHAALRK
jgi:hypothetical protein